MDMFSQFGTDDNLETNGIWLDYGEFRVKIARAGGANKKFLSYVEQKTKPLRRAIQAGALSEERSAALFYEIYAKTIVLDWQIADGKKGEETVWKKGIHKKGGGVLEVTPENIVLTFKLLPNLFANIKEAAETMTLFRVEELEADAKNS